MNWVKTMLKALLKKQLLEFFSGFTVKGNDGKSRGAGAKAGAVVLLLFVGLTFFGMFFSVSFMLVPVIESGNGELYISVFGILSVLMGLMGSVFLTYNALYEAKDNDMLLAMPIFPSMILFARMAGLYVVTLGFQLLVLIPSAVVYFMTAGFSALSFILYLPCVLILPLFTLAVSLVLGFFIALFSSKIRNKSFITVAFSLAFFAVYYFSMMKITDIINVLVYQSDVVMQFIKRWLYPFYLLGKGIYGDILSFVIFTVVTLAVFGTVYFVLSRSFLKLATVNKGQKKVRYKEKTAKQASGRLACFKKELLYFKNTPVYILNSSFGSLMLLVVAVIFAIKKDALLSIMAQNGFPVFSLPLIIGIGLCLAAASNNLSSVSVSLEGRKIYLLHSLPCDAKDVFFGKIMLHTAVTGIPLVIGNIIVCISLEAELITALLLVVFSVLFTAVLAETGLVINLLFPKMEWTNETVPVKQSLSSLLGIFSGFAYGLVMMFASIITAGFLPMQIFLLIAVGVFAVLAALLSGWLKVKGSKKFAEL